MRERALSFQEQTIRLEMCILPLIDLSVYNEFKDLAGGKPIAVDLGSFSSDTLFRVVLRLNEGRRKGEYLRTGATLLPNANIMLDWVGDWFSFWVEDSDGLLDSLKRQYGDVPRSQAGDLESAVVGFFETTAALGVQVKNPISLVGFLMAIPAAVNLYAPNMVVFNQLEPYKGVPIVQIAPNPASAWSQARRRPPPSATQSAASGPAPTTSAAASQPAVSEEAPAVYYATIGDGLYVSTQASALRGVVDRLRQDAASQPGSSEVVRANLLVYASPRAGAGVRPSVLYYFEQQARRVSLTNAAQVSLLGRCGVLEGRSVDAAACAHLGYRLVCPDGGAYTYDPGTDAAACSVHGSLHGPRRLSTPPTGSPLGRLLASLDRVLAYLRFTTDGLQTTVEVRR